MVWAEGTFNPTSSPPHAKFEVFSPGGRVVQPKQCHLCLLLSLWPFHPHFHPIFLTQHPLPTPNLLLRFPPVQFFPLVLSKQTRPGSSGVWANLEGPSRFVGDKAWLCWAGSTAGIPAGIVLIPTILCTFWNGFDSRIMTWLRNRAPRVGG